MVVNEIPHSGEVSVPAGENALPILGRGGCITFHVRVVPVSFMTLQKKNEVGKRRNELTRV